MQPLCAIDSSGSHSRRAPWPQRAVHVLNSRSAGAAIEARRAGVVITACATGCRCSVIVEPVAADDATRRMHQHLVRDAVALGVQRFQHAQRPLRAWRAPGSADSLVPHGEIQLGVPGCRRRGVGRAQRLLPEARDAARRSLLRPPAPGRDMQSPSVRAETPRGTADRASDSRRARRCAQQRTLADAVDRAPMLAQYSVPAHIAHGSTVVTSVHCHNNVGHAIARLRAPARPRHGSRCRRCPAASNTRFAVGRDQQAPNGWCPALIASRAIVLARHEVPQHLVSGGVDSTRGQCRRLGVPARMCR